MAAPPIGAPLSEVLAAHRAPLDEALARTAGARGAEHGEPWALPFVVDSDGDVDAAVANMEEALAWASGEGKAIVDAAREGVAAATAQGAWDNEEVARRAPSAEGVRPFLGAEQVQTLPSQDGTYLVYTIRAGAIDDRALLKSVTPNELSDFFLYAKEVNARVARDRGQRTGRYVAVVTANDLSGASLLGASGFRTALAAASKKSSVVHAGLSGPTLLINLPPLLGALAKAFTPLFPKKVLERLRFEAGPLRDVRSLTELLRSDPGPARARFLAEVDTVLQGMKQ